MLGIWSKYDNEDSENDAKKGFLSYAKSTVRSLS